jgi:hypothetical protein
MANTVTFEYDPARNILFTEDQFQVSTPQDVQAFMQAYQTQFEQIGHKVHIVTNIDGLFINGEISRLYGEQARALAQKYCLGFARYGAKAVSRMGVASNARKGDFDSMIFKTREEAVAAVELQKSRGDPSAK